MHILCAFSIGANMPTGCEKVHKTKKTVVLKDGKYIVITTCGKRISCDDVKDHTTNEKEKVTCQNCIGRFDRRMMPTKTKPS